MLKAVLMATSTHPSLVSSYLSAFVNETISSHEVLVGHIHFKEKLLLDRLETAYETKGARRFGTGKACVEDTH